MVLYIDLDNTVFNTTAAICEMYNEDYKYFPGFIKQTDNTVKSYNFSELECASYNDILKYFRTARFFVRVKTHPGFVRELRDLYFNHGVEIVFVSRGVEPNLAGKQEWIDNFEEIYSIPCRFIGVDALKHPDKSSVDMFGGILIDDEPKNLEASTASHNICFGNYEWNRDYTDCVRCTDWASVGDYIRKEILQNES